MFIIPRMQIHQERVTKHGQLLSVFKAHSTHHPCAASNVNACRVKMLSVILIKCGFLARAGKVISMPLKFSSSHGHASEIGLGQFANTSLFHVKQTVLCLIPKKRLALLRRAF